MYDSSREKGVFVIVLQNWDMSVFKGMYVTGMSEIGGKVVRS